MAKKHRELPTIIFCPNCVEEMFLGTVGGLNTPKKNIYFCSNNQNCSMAVPEYLVREEIKKYKFYS